MARLEIVFSEQANTDIQNLTDAIMYEFKAPLTAFKYMQGLLNEIKRLNSLFKNPLISCNTVSM